jgi:hypothetical protein
MAQENKGQAKACPTLVGHALACPFHQELSACPFQVAHPADQTWLTDTCDTFEWCDLAPGFIPLSTVRVHSVLHEAQAQTSNTLA